ncbi:hypothetical protein NNJEOMEG_01141 [Fundidesulfovibrio magnetotacticus]|uniref:Uncharacterized protein n=1 Tax=Fundidesulfovibrio magnetotacticus TaxID=2730080 RepID=A0A6V8LQQ2_9BACT|nr:hypothetical protein NNJEOMEG_01141 [Fundidesulfovibrio magnetotacticus]
MLTPHTTKTVKAVDLPAVQVMEARCKTLAHKVTAAWHQRTAGSATLACVTRPT